MTNDDNAYHDVLTGGCLCGAVRYRAEYKPINVRVCHCRLCQKAVGAAFNARILLDGSLVDFEGPYATAQSSRTFCADFARAAEHRSSPIGSRAAGPA